MALVDKLSDLTSFDYNKVGDKNTDSGNFNLNQSFNTGLESDLTKLPRPRVNSTYNKLAPAPSTDLEVITSGIISGVVSQIRGVVDSANFLKTPEGVLFVSKQAVLQSRNPFNFTKGYNPVSVPTALSSKIGEVPRHIGGQKSIDPVGLLDTYGKNIVGPTTITKRRTQNIISGNNNQKTTNPTRRISYKVSEEPLSYGLQTPLYPNVENRNEITTDFIKFFIKDPQTNRVVGLPAYLTDITDNSSAEYNPTRYIGRADQVYVYSGYNRGVSFGFRVAALTRGDVPVMWKKIEALKSMTLPAYEDNVIQNDNELRPIAPFVELTLGNYFVNQPGYFSSVNVTIPQNSSWEIEPGYELTHMADVTIEFTYIGKRLPRLTGKQYDIEYEQDVSRTREVERIVSERLEAQKKKEEESRKLNFDTTLNVNAGVTGGTPGVISPLPASLGGDD